MTKYTYDYVEKGVVKRHYVSGLKYIAVAYSHKKKALFEKFDTLEEARACYAKYAQTHSNFNGKDLKGKRFGKLVALYPVSQPDNKPMKWHCRCDCGNEVDVITNSLTSGNTTSCGATIHKKKHLDQNKKILNKKIGQYGTVPEYLLEKKRSNNQSGYKGVAKITKKNGKIKYQAKLTFARTEYTGKEYDTVREAYAERLELERKYFRPVLNRFIEDKEKELATQKSGDPIKQDLINLLYKQTKKLGRIPKSTEFKKYNQAAYRFGSWGEFVRSAGLTDDKKRSATSAKVTNEQLFRNLKREYQKTGKVPVRTKFKHGQTAVSRFGNWDTFVRAAGLEPRNSTRLKLKLSREDILKEFQKRVKELGRVPTNKEFKYYYKTVTYFGSWASFLKMAGYEDRAKKSTRVWHSNAEFIQELQDAAKRLHRIPKSTECEHGSQIVKRFGSWTKALIAADLYAKKRPD
ncbi:hypothetical protein EFN70_02510 [Pediococcus ethanolidurans]|uniref:homing endonuclease associated repeat-containing protein n=1 Tax=Pediococcus ethanolidurans TaxID=319653 RepID=UPI0021AA638D|nr:hypothetical protein [Pediococcus ethanolidurans]MCT4397554.1 hypothetical protein [Pediococcus ethanolidurans]